MGEQTTFLPKGKKLISGNATINIKREEGGGLVFENAKAKGYFDTEARYFIMAVSIKHPTIITKIDRLTFVEEIEVSEENYEPGEETAADRADKEA